MDAERATRVLLRLPLRYRMVGQTDWRPGKTENISRSGVLFVADDLFAVDTELELSFTLPEELGPASILCRGRVVRTVVTTGPQGWRPALAAAISDYGFVPGQA
jgi:hypothetical protein